MSILIMILGAVLAIFLVILIHELGHYSAARLCGVRVLKFSIGFGRSLCSYRAKRSGTEWALCIFPIGGYVKMAGDGSEEEGPVDPAVSFKHKRLPARMFIVLAGPIANFLLAIVLFWGISLHGVVNIRPIVGEITRPSIAAQAGLKDQDVFLKIGRYEVQGWQQVLTTFVRYIGLSKPVTVQVERGRQVRNLAFDLSNWELIGQHPDVFKSIGFYPAMPLLPAVVGEVLKGSPAAKFDLQPGDKILKVGNQTITHWMAFANWVQKHPNKTATVTIVRNQKQKEVLIHTGEHLVSGAVQGFFGVAVQASDWPKRFVQRVDYGFWGALGQGVDKTWQLASFNALVFVKMLLGHISLSTLSGPVAIVQTAGEASLEGWSVYLGFVAFISVALGFVNLLPIPVLDGGHFLFQLIEFVKGSPLSELAQERMMRFGIVFLLMVMILAFYNDFYRIFS